MHNQRGDTSDGVGPAREPYQEDFVLGVVDVQTDEGIYVLDNVVDSCKCSISPVFP